MNLDSYAAWSKNRTMKGGGGIATAVARQYKDLSVGAGEGKEDDEYLITRIDSFSPALNIINCYGEQRKTSEIIRKGRKEPPKQVDKSFYTFGGV